MRPPIISRSRNKVEKPKIGGLAVLKVINAVTHDLLARG